MGDILTKLLSAQKAAPAKAAKTTNEASGSQSSDTPSGFYLTPKS